MTKEKCAVITGACGGIGQVLCKRLIQDGWRLHLCDVKEEPLLNMAKQLPPETTWCQSFLDSPDACKAALEKVPGQIHALVHLAGIFEFHDLDDAGKGVYERTIQHNQTNAYDLAAAVQPKLTNNSRLVFASSLAFNRGAPDNIAYSMAKGALVGLTRALSRKLAPQGILVNAVAPGFIETPMLRHVMSERDEQALVNTVPLQRIGKASEVATVIAFLVSDDASYVTGQVINIDGGMINS